MDKLILYPGNWLYNASVIGFLSVISRELGEDVVESWLNEDGSLAIDKAIFEPVKIGKEDIPKSLVYYVEYLTENDDIEEWLEKKNKKNDEKKEQSNNEKHKEYFAAMGRFGYKLIKAFDKLFFNEMLYRNLVQQGDRKEFITILLNLFSITNNRVTHRCDFCGIERAVEPDENSKLEKRLFKFDLMHSSLLGSSVGKFPNSFWNNSTSLRICPICLYFIIHHHLALTKLEDGSEIFINAQSFQVMWYLNKYIKAVNEKAKTADVRRLLGMSVMEMALKTNIQLGKWTMMNIEAVSKLMFKIKGKPKYKIDFYSLPHEVISLLLNRKISSILSEIGETSILNLVLNQNYGRIMEIGEKVFKIALKKLSGESNKGNDDESDEDDKFIAHYFRLAKEKNDLIKISQNLFELYLLIMEKQKRRL
ncbi:hypothetical protein Calkro_2445 [Caldicellulosiruptor kronotskyensis 2002]|uniref:CRISPR-associated protein CXXC-CXXC domain-containing protein n=1 Tax=Caldicellulosiruptor kronotskyensis (strain DSM 18902 / VKM B-2412 / 2002) TaxID=632348 RepID=E4SHN1_CALK2|nr:type I-B CRISPR-associated protein Cas8b1/Cst1 [Caldicellulosiruptor kronotskyensis]ADQ47256.1 hypothetical protein Calkro_2445 [Caldicellulosiruptor kronotskyensis 2002]